MLNGKDHPIVRRYIHAAQNIGAYTEAERIQTLSGAAAFYRVIRIHLLVPPIDPDDATTFDIPAMMQGVIQEPAKFSDEEVAVLLATAAMFFRSAIPQMPLYFSDADYNDDEEDPSSLQ